MNKKISLGAAIMLMAMTAAVTITITIVIVMQRVNNDFLDFSDRSALFKKLYQVDNIVRGSYIGKINDTTLNDDLIKGYMQGIGDSGATYFNADAFSSVSLENSGQAIGVGATVISNSDGYLKVVAVSTGGPAATAGMQVGDEIISVGGNDVRDIGYTSAVSGLVGKVGSTVQLTLLRSDKQTTVTVTRKAYDDQTVVSNMIGDNIGYVKIVDFTNATASQFSSQVDSLVQKGAKGLIFDVRNNPGGSMLSAKTMIDKLIPAGAIVRTKDKSGKLTVLYTSDEKQVNLPMAVLTNQSTSSAAELFTAALKDYGKAKSIGNKTSGKGTMQEIKELKDGTAIRLSTGLIYPPKSDTFNGVGVAADTEVTLSQDKLAKFFTLAASDDDQLQAGIKYIQSLI